MGSGSKGYSLEALSLGPSQTLPSACGVNTNSRWVVSAFYCSTPSWVKQHVCTPRSETAARLFSKVFGNAQHPRAVYAFWLYSTLVTPHLRQMAGFLTQANLEVLRQDNNSGSYCRSIGFDACFDMAID